MPFRLVPISDACLKPAHGIGHQQIHLLGLSNRVSNALARNFMDDGDGNNSVENIPDNILERFISFTEDQWLGLDSIGRLLLTRDIIPKVKELRERLDSMHTLGLTSLEYGKGRIVLIDQTISSEGDN